MIKINILYGIYKNINFNCFCIYLKLYYYVVKNSYILNYRILFIGNNLGLIIFSFLLGS